MIEFNSILITKEPTHGARITCYCGWADKSMPKMAKNVAEQHNRKSHENRFAIDGGITK